MDTLIQKTITIVDAKVDEKGNIKVKDEKGLTYTIWKTKQDGNMTVAFNQASQMNLLGGTFNISHDEKPVPGGTGAYRAIKAIYAPTAKPMPQNTQSATSAPKTPYKPVSALPQAKETDWDKISWGKCKHAFLVEFVKANFILPAGERSTKEVMEKEAELFADMSMRSMSKKSLAQEQREEFGGQFDEPPMPDNEEIRVEDIPF